MKEPRLSRTDFDVSLVITVFNHWQTTRRCLDSIYRCAEISSLHAEVILSDNCSEDETPTAWKGYLGRPWPIRYFRNAENLGYLRNANAGARRASGEFLCLMNNDVVVFGNWLDVLIGTIRASSDIGLVAPKYLIPAGRTLECGVAVRSDGMTVMMGNECDADDPRFGFTNDVDYCSMACAVTPRSVFAELGGYDEQYIPAYYEDADYCFRLRDQGYRVVVNPEANVVHAHGVTLLQKDRARWMPIVQQHREQFIRRWAKRLAERQPGPNIPPARYRSWGRKSAYVFHGGVALDSLTEADLENLAESLRQLHRRGNHAVVVVPRSRNDDRPAGHLQRIGVEVHRFKNVAGLEWLARELAAAHPIEAVFATSGLEPVLAQIYSRWSPAALQVRGDIGIPTSGITAVDAAATAALRRRDAEPKRVESSDPEPSAIAIALDARWSDPAQFESGGPLYGEQGQLVRRLEARINRISIRPIRKVFKLALWLVSLHVLRQIRARIFVSEWFGPTGRIDRWLATLRPKPLRRVVRYWYCTLTLQPRKRLD